MHCPTGTPGGKAKLFQTIEDSGRFIIPDGCLSVSDYFTLPALSTHRLNETFYKEVKGKNTFKAQELHLTRVETKLIKKLITHTSPFQVMSPTDLQDLLLLPQEQETQQSSHVCGRYMAVTALILVVVVMVMTVCLIFSLQSVRQEISRRILEVYSAVTSLKKMVRFQGQTETKGGGCGEGSSLLRFRVPPFQLHFWIRPSS